MVIGEAYFDGVTGAIRQKDVLVVWLDAGVSTCDVFRRMASHNLHTRTVAVCAYTNQSIRGAF